MKPKQEQDLEIQREAPNMYQIQPPLLDLPSADYAYFEDDRAYGEYNHYHQGYYEDPFYSYSQQGICYPPSYFEPNAGVFEYPYARPPRPPTSHKTKADVTFMSNNSSQSKISRRESIDSQTCNRLTHRSSGDMIYPVSSSSRRPSLDSSSSNFGYLDGSANTSKTHVVSNTSSSSTGEKKKRSQVKRACLNCRKVSKKCSDCRPCVRCVSKGLECVDAVKSSKKSNSDRAAELDVGSWRSDSSLDYHMNILAIGNYSNDVKGLTRYLDYSDDGFPLSTQESFTSEY